MILAVMLLVGITIGWYIADIFIGDTSCEALTPAPRGGIDHD